ncbi:MAG: cell envelope integrity protein TolA [Deltaproteobacteria bacterium]|nr:cell envelope integrity protein TolA [Deltaproteobacteria bacterium]
MDGIHFDDRDFFQEQQEEDRCWKWPLNLAIVLHIVIFAASIFLPDLIERRPLLDDIVTVDLVSMPEPAAALPPATKPVLKPAQSKTPVKAPEPVSEPEVAEISVASEPEVAPEPSAPAKPISLKPLKRKVRKAKDTRLAEEKEREQRAKELQQKTLAQKKAKETRKRAEKLRRQKALAEARRSQQEADRAAARARQELASVIRETGAVSTAGSSSGRKVQSVVIKQYLSSLYDRVHSYWILPEMRTWDRSLEAIVVLTIRKDGSISNMQFERKSRDPFFDQFVMKTLQTAAPMPRFPALMSQASIEVGLRFKPGELKM